MLYIGRLLVPTYLRKCFIEDPWTPEEIAHDQEERATEPIFPAMLHLDLRCVDTMHPDSNCYIYIPICFLTDAFASLMSLKFRVDRPQYLFEILEKLPNLRKLALWSSGLFTSGEDSARYCKKYFEEFDEHHQESYERCPQLPKLQDLEWMAGLTERLLSLLLRKCPNLLHLRGIGKIAFREPDPALPFGCDLDLDTVKTMFQGVSKLQTCTGFAFENLTFFKALGDNCTNLTSLTVGYALPAVKANDTNFLNFPNLEKLQLQMCPGTRCSVEDRVWLLQCLSRVRCVDVSSCWFRRSFLGEDVGVLSVLENVEQLTLSLLGKRYLYEFLKELQNLKYLCIKEGGIRKRDLKYLKKYGSHLEELVLNGDGAHEICKLLEQNPAEALPKLRCLQINDANFEGKHKGHWRKLYEKAKSLRPSLVITSNLRRDDFWGDESADEDMDDWESS